MTLIRRHYLFLIAVLPLAYIPFVEWIWTAQNDTIVLLCGQALYGLSGIAGAVAVAAWFARTFHSNTRSPSQPYFALAIVFVSSCIGGLILGHATRMAEMSVFAERSRPLIAAIERYERDNSMPPRSLQHLVPNYLPAVPSTGMNAYPEYGYQTGADTEQKYAGNRWVLSVATPKFILNWDLMLYFPNQRYPTHGYGGGPVRIGGWAYVVE